MRIIEDGICHKPSELEAARLRVLVLLLALETTDEDAAVIDPRLAASVLTPNPSTVAAALTVVRTDIPPFLRCWGELLFTLLLLLMLPMLPMLPQLLRLPLLLLVSAQGVDPLSAFV